MADFSKFSRAIQEAIGIAYQDLVDQGLPITVPAGLPLPKPVGSVYALSATRSYLAASTYTYEPNALVVRNSVPAFNTGASTYTIQGRYFNKPSASNGWLVDLYMPNGEVILFDRCVFATATNGDMLHITNDSRVRFRNCIFLGTGNQAPGILGARGIFAERPRLIDVQNCYFGNTAGCKLNNWSTNITSDSDTITWKYNRYDNIMGGLNSDYCQALQLQHIIRPGIQIAYNQIINTPGASRVEDSFNFGESGGTPASPLLVQDNLIWGGYQSNPTAGGYTGAAITTDAGNQDVPANLQPQYIIAERNMIAGYQNACMNIAAGHHNRYINNEMVVSGFMPDGKTKLEGLYNAISIFRGQDYTAAQFDYNEISGNAIFTNSANGKGPFFENSLDPNVQPYKRYAGPNSKALLSGNTLNTYRDGAKYSDEQALFAKWQAKLTANKIQVGVPAKA